MNHKEEKAIVAVDVIPIITGLYISEYPSLKEAKSIFTKLAREGKFSNQVKQYALVLRSAGKVHDRLYADELTDLLKQTLKLKTP